MKHLLINIAVKEQDLKLWNITAVTPEIYRAFLII